METPAPDIKLTPGNRRQKGRRSAPKAEARLTGKPEPYEYTFDDPRIGTPLPILSTANAWWAGIQGAVKLQKLVDAYCFLYTDMEACSYAGISKTQLDYFSKLHPDFYSIKEIAKAQPDMHAKKKIVEAASKDVNWSAWLIQRTQKKQFSPRLDITSDGERIAPVANEIAFVDFSDDEDEAPALPPAPEGEHTEDHGNQGQ